MARRREQRRIRYAVVGQGYFAQAKVLPAFANAPNSQLVALFSSDPTKLRRLRGKYGAEYALHYAEYDDFLRSGAVDAVYIALPNHLHCEYTLRAARAGAHVLCEKPMAVTVDECRRMIRACRDARVKLMIGYRLHFEESNMCAVDLATRGRLGELRSFQSSFSYQVKRDNIRTSGEAGGGPLFDLGVYCINAARYLFRDEPEEVFAWSVGGRDRRFREVEEQIAAVLRFPRGRLATFTVGFGSSATSWWELLGTRGGLRADPAYEYDVPLAQTLTVGGRTKEREFAKTDQVAPELIYFSDCVLEDREPEPDGEEGLADVRVIDALHRSVAGDRPVAITERPRVRRPSAKQIIRRPARPQPPLVDAEEPVRE